MRPSGSHIVASGALAHGDAYTITGSGFGTKSGSTPALFDQGTASVNTIDSQWTGGWPSAASSGNNIQLQSAGFRSIAAPHARCLRFYAGCHQDLNSSTSGNNVGLWSTYTRPSTSYYTYLRWLTTHDPLWPFNNDGTPGNGGTNDNNTKMQSFNNGSSPYPQGSSSDSNWYIGYNNSANQDVANPYFWGINGDDNSLQNPDTNGHNGFWPQAPGSPYQSWRNLEMEIKHSTADDGGYIKLWDNNTLAISYVGVTDRWTGTTKNDQIGGYARNRDATRGFRYFADPYIDRQTSGAARIVLTDSATYESSTIIEVQKYTSWSPTSIGLICNRGALPTGPAHKHFRCPVNGNQYDGTVTLQ